MTRHDRPVLVQVGDVTYRGRHSVRQVGDRVWIDGLLVGVECDADGEPLDTPSPLPEARVARSWWARLWEAWRAGR